MNLYVWSGLGTISKYVLMDICQFNNNYVFWIGTIMCTSLAYMRGLTGNDLITNVKSLNLI